VKHGREKLLLIVCLTFIVSASPDAASPSEEIRIGSKKFTESVIVADLAAKLATSIGARVVIARSSAARGYCGMPCWQGRLMCTSNTRERS
jgi:glycine betaine/choline ABC-type transport system substrate-binding protein